jgi:hypothetical protein
MRRGARVVRRLTKRQLADWRQPPEAAAHIVVELAATAVQHGRVPGSGFRLTLVLDAEGVLRIEVTDVRAERLPLLSATPSPRTASWALCSGTWEIDRPSQPGGLPLLRLHFDKPRDMLPDLRGGSSLADAPRHRPRGRRTGYPARWLQARGRSPTAGKTFTAVGAFRQRGRPGGLGRFE